METSSQDQNVNQELEKAAGTRNIQISYKVVYLVIGLSVLLITGCIFIGYAIGLEGNNSNNSSSTSTTSTSFNDFTFPEFDFNNDQLDPSLYGLWEMVIPTDESASVGPLLGMQFVHSVMLPSGKVLLASGSSWRNNEAWTEVYPFYQEPNNHNGLFHYADKPFEYTTEKRERYYKQVNSVGIYDPIENTFFRIPHPLPNQVDDYHENQFIPTDLFCSDHIQLQDGNILWIGGTQYYLPYRTGNRATHIFNWTKELTINWTDFDWTVMPDEDDEFYPWVFTGM